MQNTTDVLFDLILATLVALHNLEMLDDDVVLERALNNTDKLLKDHHADPQNSALRTKLPSIGTFFTDLPFKEAFIIYNRKYNISKRRHVPPTICEIRHVFNIAQGIALTDKLKLLTFDGDETLYPDGENFDDDEMASFIVQMIRKGVNVGIITAAGYGNEVECYEERIRGLLDYLANSDLSEEQKRSFFLMGGESNYLLRCNGNCRLDVVSPEAWLVSDYKADEITTLLNVAERALESLIADLDLRARIIRKERAVGLIPGGDEGRLRAPTGSGGKSLKFEILEEAVQRIRCSISSAGCTIPYCAFNGGRDMWVDIGNKAEGLRILQRFLQVAPDCCAHIGDQFSESGNDIAARDACPTFWITNPIETKAVMRSLLRQMGVRPEISPVSSPEEFTPKANHNRKAKQRDSIAEEQEWLDSPTPTAAASTAKPPPSWLK